MTSLYALAIKFEHLAKGLHRVACTHEQCGQEGADILALCMVTTHMHMHTRTHILTHHAHPPQAAAGNTVSVLISPTKYK